MKLCVCGYPGWVPVQKNNKQYCWHSSVLDQKTGAALVLRPGADDGDSLEMAAVPLEDLMEQTLELIGTNVNGNPYGNVRPGTSGKEKLRSRVGVKDHIHAV